MVDYKIIGLVLALLASCAIGTSYPITKTGLARVTREYGAIEDGHKKHYLKDWVWWLGQITLVSGECMNTVAYAFAPAILVTPLGALSVLIGAVMSRVFLGEEVRTVGKVGCAVCLLGSVMLVLHAPADRDIKTVDEIIHLAIQPFFLLYLAFITLSSVFLVIKVVPKHGDKNPLVYTFICSGIGSISVMAVKAVSIAVRLTSEGHNQFTHPSTYAFLVVLIMSTLTQMNYLNKAIDQFSATIINALYYVVFTTCTLTASFILYQGLNTSDIVATLSLFTGFLLNFIGVALLTMSHEEDGDYSLVDIQKQNTGQQQADAEIAPIRSSEGDLGESGIRMQSLDGNGVQVHQVDYVPNEGRRRSRRVEGSLDIEESYRSSRRSVDSAYCSPAQEEYSSF